MKTSYNVATDFNLVIEALTTVAESNIENTLKTVSHIAELNTAITGNKFDYYLTHTHCNKSGNFIAAVSNDEIAKLIAIHGEDFTAYVLKLQADKSIAHHWIKTDDTALEKLLQFDPVGYFVFAASMIAKVFTFHAPLYKINNNHDKHYSDNHYKVHCEIADLNRELQDCPIEEIIKGNELMRRFLSIFDSTRVASQVKFTAKTMTGISDDITLWNNEVKSNLKQLLLTALKKGKIKRELDISDIANLKIEYHGYSNFRKQGTIKGFTESEMLISQLDAFMPDYNDNATNAPWKQRALIKEKTRIKPQIATSGFQLSLTAKKKLPSLMDIAAMRNLKKENK